MHDALFHSKFNWNASEWKVLQTISPDSLSPCSSFVTCPVICACHNLLCHLALWSLFITFSCFSHPTELLWDSLRIVNFCRLISTSFQSYHTHTPAEKVRTMYSKCRTYTRRVSWFFSSSLDVCPCSINFWRDSSAHRNGGNDLRRQIWSLANS